jgi:DNA-binding NtrC family response regulator
MPLFSSPSRAGGQLSPRVLVIDDEPALRRSLERALLHFGYDVRCAADANSAYEILAETPVDAVLLDIRMPHLAGDTFFLALIRRWPALEARVVLMTGDVWSVGEGWPDELRACPLLAKPFSLDVLRDTLHDLLAAAERRPRRQNGNG